MLLKKPHAPDTFTIPCGDGFSRPSLLPPLLLPKLAIGAESEASSAGFAPPNNNAHQVAAYLSAQPIHGLGHLQGPKTTRIKSPRANPPQLYKLFNATIGASTIVTCKLPPPSPGMSFESAHSTALRIRCVGGMLSSVCSNG